MSFSNSMAFGPTFIPGKVGDTRPIVVWDDFVTAYTALDATEEIPMDQSGKFCDIADAGEWLLSVGDSSPSVYPSMADESGGVVTMTTDTGANDRVSCQRNGEMFSLANGRELYFEVRAHISTSADFYAGVVLADVNLTGITNGVIMGISGTSTLQTRVEKDSGGAITNTGTTVEDDAYSVFAFKCRADKKIEFYLNGVKASMVNDPDNFPDDELLSPVFQIQTNTVGVAETLKVDYILCVGER